MSKSLAKSAGIFSAMTLISRISGLIRDQVYAIGFGASPAMDAFLVAFRIPNFMRKISAEGAFSMAFVPVLQEYRATASPSQVKELIDRVTGSMIAILLVIVGLALLGAPWIMRWIAPGFALDQLQLATELLRITFPYILFVSLASLVGAVLNSYGKFAIPALSPVLLNLTMIGAALLVAPQVDVPIKALAWGVFAAGLFQLLFHLPFLARLGLVPSPKWGAKHAGVRRMIQLMGPTIFGASVSQLNLLINTIIATSLMAGSVTWLYYTERLIEFPLGMFGVAIGTVILPQLSMHFATNDQDNYSRGLDWGLRLCILIGIPAAVGLALCAKALIATLFMYGEFTSFDAQMTAWSLFALAFALPAFLLVKVLAPAFYSRQDTTTPVKAALVSMAVNLVSGATVIALVMWTTRQGQLALHNASGDFIAAMRNVDGLHVALAAAIAMAGWANALSLAWYLRKSRAYTPSPGWGRHMLKIVVAAGAMAAWVAFVNGQWTQWDQWHALQRTWRLLAMVGSGALVYFGLLLAQGVKPREILGH